MDALARQRVQRVHITCLGRDRLFAALLESTLAEAGITSTISEIESDASLSDDAILDAIRDASALILLCTEASLRNRRVRREMELAWRFERPIVPLLLEPLLFPDDVAYWLEGDQWIEVFPEGRDWQVPLLSSLTIQGLAPDVPDGANAIRFPHQSSTSLPRTQLPAPAGRLVGREAELLELSRLVSAHRLVTLTGVGGSGKSRIAMELGRLVRPLFPDGVYFVDLSATNDARAVPELIGRKLGIEPFSGESFDDIVMRSLRDRRLLLILDNFEQVRDAGDFVSRLLLGCADLGVLVTSRVSIGLAGEREFELGPLELPDDDTLMSVDALAQTDAIEFFVERAQAANPSFALTDRNASDVANLCAALDGLPLAIELVAGKSRLLTPGQMVQRFAGTSGVLSVAGAADRPDRQRTLRQTIAWSVELLNPPERRAFTWMAVFAGGATLEAIEAVFERAGLSDSADTLACVEALVQQHLLTHFERGSELPRFRMLVSVHAFAREALEGSDDLAVVRRAHGEVYLELLSEASEGLTGHDQSAWLTRLDADYENCLAAVDWAFEVAPEQLIDSIGALWLYWSKHGGLREGLSWLKTLTDEVIYRDADLASKLMNVLGNISCDIGDWDQAVVHFERSRALAEELGRMLRVGSASIGLGIVFENKGDFEEARRMFSTALQIGKDWNDPEMVAVCIDNLGDTFREAGQIDQAVSYHHEALAMFEALGDMGGQAYTYWRLGSAELARGEVSIAEDYARMSAQLFADAQDALGVCYAQSLMASVERERGNLGIALELLSEVLSFHVRERLEYLLGVLEDVALTAPINGAARSLATLLGYCDEARGRMSRPASPLHVPVLQTRIERVRSELDSVEFDLAWLAGRALATDSAIALAESLMDAS